MRTKNSDLKYFRAIWIGEKDDDGFVTKDKMYTINRIMATGHYEFINNFGNVDLAHPKYFKVLKISKPNFCK